MFSQLSNRYIIDGALTFDTPFHIGSGESGTSTDSLVVKYFGSEPYIPGSSFKGVLRSTVERIARALGIDTCSLYSKDECNTVINKEFDNNTGWKKIKEDLPKTEDDYIKILLENVRSGNGLCRTCRLFGSTFLASKIYVDDLKLIGDPIPTEIRDGVGIDRDTGTAVEGVKYDYEVVPHSQRFSLKMKIENADDRDLSLLSIGLREFMEGVKLGGMTSRGLGSCKLEDNGTVSCLKLDTPTEKNIFLRYLATGEIEASSKKGLGDFIKTQIEKIKIR